MNTPSNSRRLRERIEDGTYPFASLLPSARHLAAAHDVSTATVQHALVMLGESGHARHVMSKPYQVIWRRREAA